jgi:uncharacterized protein YjbI with pentapeptide repeats
LSKVDLRASYLNRATLSAANLTGANLSGANLQTADLSKATLTGANLSWANFNGATLRRANVQNVLFYETALGNANLRGATGLDLCRHQGPSTVDHRTLAQSGPLPIAFLRGCGLPDALIEYLPSLLRQPFEFYSCFISYSTKDQEFADRLYADLQAKGVRCWFAPHDVQAGKKLHEQIDEAIRLHERLLLLLSHASMESDWVKTEIAKARKRELKERRRILFPIRLVEFEVLRDWECFDADTGKDSAREIREYFIPDFSRWKDHDLYQLAFERLLRNLKADAPKP